MNVKKYVFLQGTVAGVGGAQMYSITKARWLRENGWDVAVVYAADGDAVLDYSGIQLEHCEALFLRPGALPRGVIEKTLNGMASLFSGADQIVIETNVIDFSVWGELFAEKFNGTNFIFSLGEKPPLTSKEEREFYKAKYRRGELASITESFLDALFLEHEIGYKEAILIAHEGSAVADIPIEEDFLPQDCDYVIGLVSRLEKSFVRDAVQGIAAFAKKYRDKKICCVCVGNSSDRAAVNFIQKNLSGEKNVCLMVLGEFSPLPRKLLASFDVAVAKAGCVHCCLEAGVLTIAYKMDEDVPMGVVCYDIPAGAKEPSSNGHSLVDYLERVLVVQVYKNAIYPYEKRNVDFTLHQRFLDRILDVNQGRKCYLTSHLPKPPLAKCVLAWMALAIGRYPFELKNGIRKMLKLANG